MPNREIMCESGTGQCDGHITNATVPCAVKRHITYLDNTHTLVHDIQIKYMKAGRLSKLIVMKICILKSL